MNPKKLALGGAGLALLIAYNSAQPSLRAMRTMSSLEKPTYASKEEEQDIANAVRKQRYGPSLAWLNRLMKAKSQESQDLGDDQVLDFRMMSSMMLAGLASGFKSQVANLLWMKSDEYWHKGMLARQNPIMEAVVTLDPQFLEAWDTAGWHWSYNIYADLPNRPDLTTVDKKMKPDEVKRRKAALRKEQEKAIRVGLRYYARGTEMNPDKYFLWFKYGWTRAQKAGMNDERTVELYKIARTKPDARLQEVYEPDPKNPRGEPKKIEVQGIDLMGRTIGHAYERMPHIEKALATYSDLLSEDEKNRTGLKPSEAALLRECGRYWGLYTSHYDQVVSFYQGADSVTKAEVKKLIPDIDRMVAAQAMRAIAAGRHKGQGSQPTGAYVSIVARYLPAWNLYKAGKYDAAGRTIIGVMNPDLYPQYHLQGRETLKKVLALRGDSVPEINRLLKDQIDYEREATQEMGLHFLGMLFEAMMKKEPLAKPAGPNGKLTAENYSLRAKAYGLIAYDMWCRARERDTLDFQAQRMAYQFSDLFGFADPKYLIDAIAASRHAGDVTAQPKAMPDVNEYIERVQKPALIAKTPRSEGGSKADAEVQQFHKKVKGATEAAKPSESGHSKDDGHGHSEGDGHAH